MKTGFWDRALIYLYVLLTLVVVVALALRAFSVDLIGMFIEGLRLNAPGLFWRLIVLGISAVVAILGAYVAVVITPSRKKNSFVTINSNGGSEVRISLPAIREMAKQAISGIGGLKDVVIDVSGSNDALSIGVAMDVESSVHVPSVTMDMQNAIMKNIEKHCGVAVRTVTVDVKNVLPGSESVVETGGQNEIIENAQEAEASLVPVIDPVSVNDDEIIILDAPAEDDNSQT